MNLTKRIGHFSVNWKIVVLVFIVAFFTQIYFLYSTYSDGLENLKKNSEQAARVKALEGELQAFSIPKEASLLANLVEERNQWFAQKSLSPLKILERLEQNRPLGIELQAFSASREGGAMKLLTPDLDTASRFVHAVFGNNTGSLSVKEQTQGRLVVQYTWTG